jgi:adenine-specific DNA-methyltransferase
MENSLQLVQKLVQDFKAQEKVFLSPSYQESQARQDFIDKFFEALGWDVTHDHQRNPYAQEVHIENKVMMASSSQRRADYAFSISPNYEQIKFFVEAKKPSRSLSNADDYFQTIRYAWNSRTSIAVLTDFEEFHILDCRYKPNIKNALERKIASYHYADYVNDDTFAKIFHLFGREAVQSGSLETFTATLPKKGTKAAGGLQPVDDAFLEDLDEYRVILAKAFKKTNEQLQGEELTEAVQRTIDRLVFIRFLEDKGIEDNHIIGLDKQTSSWKGFLALCKRLEPKYNGLVFKPHRILDSGEFNTPDDKAFAEICKNLSDPSSPYDFNQIPISILGSIYERFLGKVVHATDKRVKVEEKHEVRKAGGVYYTPQYIVKYIVKETVGKLIEGKTPAEISKMAFADIACGSGSFLIEVYDQLLEYHVRYYAEHPDEATSDHVFFREGILNLALKKKKEILLNNIYGVDIDYQATEVTQLSLYLKMLEHATMQEAHQFGMFKERILPDLRRNIVCGNSLVARDIEDSTLFPDVNMAKIRPMNYEEVFPEIMKRGGYDAIVGNPPYGAEIGPLELNYLKRKYNSEGNDTYALFIEQAVRLSKAGSFISMIVPTGWYSGSKYSLLRKYFMNYTKPTIFVNLPYDIFNAWVDTTIFVTAKKSQNDVKKPNLPDVKIITFPKKHRIISDDEFDQYGNDANIEEWFSDGADIFLTYADVKATRLIKKINNASRPLSDYTDIQRGVTPFILTETPEHINSKPAFNGNVRRYLFDRGKPSYIRFDETLAEPKPERYFVGPRILMRELISRQFQLQAVKVEDIFITNKSMQSILITDSSLSINYFLGILNSKLMSWYFIHRSNVGQRDDFPKIVLKETRSLPFIIADITDPASKLRHDQIVILVEDLLQSKDRLVNTTIEVETNRLELRCEILDRQIDEAVYALYGLTEEEIRIVEGTEDGGHK